MKMSRLLRLSVAVKLCMSSRAWQYAVAYTVVVLGYLWLLWLGVCP